MKLATKLRIAALVPAIMAIVLTFGFLRLHQSSAEIRARQDQVYALSDAVEALDSFATTYLFTDEEQALQQYRIVHTNTLQFISEIEGETPAEQVQLEHIAEDVGFMKSLLLEYASTNEKSRPASALASERTARLREQFFLRSQGARQGVSSLNAILQLQSSKTQRDVLVSIIALSGAAAAALTLMLLSMARGITRPLAAVMSGTERIGAGDLEHRIALSGKDEIAELASAVNLMAGNLKNVTASHDELERLQADLRRANQLREAHLQNSPLAVIEFDPDFHIVRWSDEAERIFGYTAEEVLGKAIDEFSWVYAEDRASVREEARKLIEDSQPRGSVAYRNYRKDGTVIWCEWYNSAIQDDLGNMLSTMSQVLDITARREAEVAMKRDFSTASAINEVLQATLLLDNEQELAVSCLKVAQKVTSSCAGYIVEIAKSGDLRVVASTSKDETTDAPVEEGLEALFRGVIESGNVTVSNQPTLDAVGICPHPLAKPHAFLGVPVRSAKKDINDGLIALVSCGGGYSARQRAVVKAMAPAVMQAREHLRAQHREAEARRFAEGVNQIDVVIHSSLEFGQRASDALELAARALGADSALIAMHEESSFRVTHSWGLEVAIEELPFEDLGEPSTFIALHSRTPIVIEDTETDERCKDGACELLQGARAALLAPLTAEGKAVGCVHLNFAKPRSFSVTEVEFVAHVASTLSLSMENAQHYESQKGIAETLQDTLVAMPSRLPRIVFSRAYESATGQSGRVGGDFVDLFLVDESCIGITLGDVSGKGIDAAVVTSLVRTTLRVHALDGLPSEEVAEKANQVICRSTDISSFATLWFGLLNTKTGELSYVSCGHPPALFVHKSADKPAWLETGGALLGAFEGVTYTRYHATMSPGDRLVLYSDGVTEARSPEGEFLGEEWLGLELLRHKGRPTQELAPTLMAEVLAFSGDDLRDDAAILVVEPTRLRHR